MRLRLRPAAERQIRKGHPWVFSDSVASENRPGKLGELAVIYDKGDRFLAVGLYDPGSPLRVRIIHRGAPVTIDLEWWKSRLQAALARRPDFAREQTNGYRCINGESDGWPALVLDRYGSTYTLKLYSAIWLPKLAEVVGLFVDELKPERLVLRLSRNIQQNAEKIFERRDGQVLSGTRIDGPVIFKENGLQFEADVARGQKTGFFLDQRENRQKVERLARGRTVLNAFSFSGGFSVYAARGGAVSVVDLDISKHALESARRNFALNVSATEAPARAHELVQADAFEWLTNARERKFGLAILDPPSLAKRASDRPQAMAAYRKLIGAGMARLERGGILVAASCSAHVSEDEFFELARSVAKGTKFEELFTTGHPVDHPASFAEASYLKGIFLRF